MEKKKGSSVKCVDAFHIASTEEPKFITEQNTARPSWLAIPIIILRYKDLFNLIC